MRKLLVVTAAAAGILMSTVAANATTPAGTYTASHGGSYSLCVTNSVVNSGATQMVQIDLGGLPRQPQSLTSPAGWSASTSSVGGVFTITWVTFGMGVGPNVKLCGFGFQMHGKLLKTTLPLTITEMTPSGLSFQTIASSAVRG